jgi:ABC-type Fe3+ transport system permease subunit
MSQPTTKQPEHKQRKKRRVFFWVFLVIQAIFLIWIISALATAGPGNCNGLDKESCQAASDVGTGIGVALIIGLWAVVDFILGIGYAIYRLSKRS